MRNRAIRTPVPLEEGAERFDRAYLRLRSAPPDEIATARGSVHVVDRHSCAFGARRFGHVVLNYRGRVVSLLVTANEERPAGALAAGSPTTHVHGQPVNGLSVVSVQSPRHVILLVSDLDEHELTQLSEIVSIPLTQQLEENAFRAGLSMLAVLGWTGSIDRVPRRPGEVK